MSRSGLWVPPTAAPPLPPHPPGRRPVGAVVAVAVGLLALAGAVTLVARVFLVYAGHDRIDFVEDQRILDAVAGPCDALAVTGAGLDPLATAPHERATQLRELADVMRAIPGAVRALDADVLAGDVPAGDWADDWDAVTAAVVAYADALDTQGGGAFDMPASEDGFTVTFRMDSAVPGCVLPPVVEQLDPDPPRSVAEAELANRS